MANRGSQLGKDSGGVNPFSGNIKTDFSGPVHLPLVQASEADGALKSRIETYRQKAGHLRTPSARDNTRFLFSGRVNGFAAEDKK